MQGDTVWRTRATPPSALRGQADRRGRPAVARHLDRRPTSRSSSPPSRWSPAASTCSPHRGSCSPHSHPEDRGQWQVERRLPILAAVASQPSCGSRRRTDWTASACGWDARPSCRRRVRASSTPRPGQLLGPARRRACRRRPRPAHVPIGQALLARATSPGRARSGARTLFLEKLPAVNLAGGRRAVLGGVARHVASSTPARAMWSGRARVFRRDDAHYVPPQRPCRRCGPAVGASLDGVPPRSDDVFCPGSQGGLVRVTTAGQRLGAEVDDVGRRVVVEEAVTVRSRRFGDPTAVGEQFLT